MGVPLHYFPKTDATCVLRTPVTSSANVTRHSLKYVSDSRGLPPTAIHARLKHLPRTDFSRDPSVPRFNGQLIEYLCLIRGELFEHAVRASKGTGLGRAMPLLELQRLNQAKMLLDACCYRGDAFWPDYLMANHGDILTGRYHTSSPGVPGKHTFREQTSVGFQSLPCVLLQKRPRIHLCI